MFVLNFCGACIKIGSTFNEKGMLLKKSVKTSITGYNRLNKEVRS